MNYKIFCIIPLLSACSFDFIKFDDVPVVKATYSSNPTKQSIRAAGGKPDSVVNLPEINGICLNYTLRKGEEVSPFYISFDKHDKPTHYGYITCDEAKKKGIFK